MRTSLMKSLRKRTKTRQHRILVVDDEPLSIAPMMEVLTLLDCKTEYCGDGKEAKTKLVKNNYDLVILDWYMPGFGGFETLLDTDCYLNYIDSLKTPTPYIVYSGLMSRDVELPVTKFFDCVDQWNKNARLSAITKKLSKIIKRL